MRACALASLVLLSCECATVIRRRTIEPLAANLREELPSLYIPCKLNDIVTITAPHRYKTNAEYYLYKPNGDVTQLNIKPPSKHEETETVVKFNKHEDKYFMWPKERFKVDNVNAGKKEDSKTNDVFGVEKNEIVIGPLGEDDYGNWVLSLFATENGKRVEWFLVITMDISEYVPFTEFPSAQRMERESLEFGFAYPVKNLTSCQLIVPSSSYDRFYERSSNDSCKFIIRNITSDDNGFWVIIGVGRITYWGQLYLRVSMGDDNGLPSDVPTDILPPIFKKK